MLLPFLFIYGLRGGEKTLYLRERRILVYSWITGIVHRIPIVYEMHELPSFRGRLGFLQRVALHFCKKIVVISGVQKSILVRMGYPESKIAVIPDAGDEKISYVKGGVELREKLGLPEDKIIVAYSGQLSEWKRPEFILEAAGYLRDRDDIVFLFLGGVGRDLERMKEKAGELGLGEKVIFKGFVNPSIVPLYLKSSDILVHYSASRGDMASLSPLKLFEYMLAGKPIVAPDYPYVREVVSDGVEAKLFSYDSPRELAEAILYLLEHRSEARKMAERARKKALSRYTYGARAEKILREIF